MRLRPALAALFLSCAPVSADVIFAFTGALTNVQGAAPAGVEPGALVLFFYRFDQNTPDANPFPDQGDYLGSIIADRSALAVGTYAFEPTDPGDIFVINDGFGGDGYTARMTRPDETVEVFLNDFSGSALTDDSLPTTLSVSQWVLREVVITAGKGAGAWEAHGTIFDILVTSPCYPDCNTDGKLNLADFGCFQTKFALSDLYADCNGDSVLNLSDFGCFQTQFALGCP
jgi:hypothetical protein